MPNMRGPPPPMPSGPPPPIRGGPPPQLPPHLAGADPEKAQLIMQVLQLTDEQIAMLPPEQRQSIMVLKEQISQGQR
jgi:cleavage stimulation factor subunit 2